jgi:hypothetical protein
MALKWEIPLGLSTAGTGWKAWDGMDGWMAIEDMRWREGRELSLDLHTLLCIDHPSSPANSDPIDTAVGP